LQQEKNAPELERKADEIIHEAKAIIVKDEDSVSEYYNWSRQAAKTRNEILSWMQKPQYCLPFLQSGRLVRVASYGKEWGWGIIMQSRKLNTSNGGIASDKTHKALGNVNGAQEEYVIDVLLEVLTQEMKDKFDKAHAAANGGMIQEIENIADISAPSGFFACPKGLAAEAVALEVIPVSLSAVTNFSAVRIQLPKDIRKEPAKRTVQKTFREVLRRFASQSASDKAVVSAITVTPTMPLLDPVKDMAISDAQFKELLSREDELQQRISACQFHSAPDRDEQLTAYSKKMKLLEAAGAFRAEARTSQAVALKDELKRMKRVLRRLGFVTPDGVLEAKGRLACEISTTTGYELVLTDMIFDGFFNALSVEQSVALISCFVHQEAVKEGAEKVRQDLQIPFRHLQAIARNVARVSIEAKIAMDEEEFVKAFNPDLMDVTYAWCQGAKFSEICRMTDVFEGSIIRVIRRLEELLRQLAAAALAIGNAELRDKFEAGADKMRRGIVFAASLYL
jgi:ATP-dependent RNA helicase DOB1